MFYFLLLLGKITFSYFRSKFEYDYYNIFLSFSNLSSDLIIEKKKFFVEFAVLDCVVVSKTSFFSIVK